MENYFTTEKIMALIKYAFPEMDDILPLRHQILSAVKAKQPVGRRVLSMTIDQTERVVRRECNILKDQNLIDFSTDGMRITLKGDEILDILTEIIAEVNGIHSLEEALARKLNIKKVIIGSTGITNEEVALGDIGYEGAKYLHSIMQDNMILGLTGGSSIEKVVAGYRDEWHKFDPEHVTIVPARGGLGRRTEYQGNTLVEKLALKMNADYRVLYTQDNLSKSTIEELKNEPSIKSIIDKIDQIDTLVFGIGRADVMAKRRFLHQSEIDEILEKGAVAESFGYYFNKAGEIVHEISTIGIDLDKYKELKNIIAVAGGTNKVEAISAISKLNSELVLVTDEETAKTIMTI